MTEAQEESIVVQICTSQHISWQFPKAGRVNLHDAYEGSNTHDLWAVNGQMEKAKYNFPAESVRILVVRQRGVHEIP